MADERGVDVLDVLWGKGRPKRPPTPANPNGASIRPTSEAPRPEPIRAGFTEEASVSREDDSFTARIPTERGTITVTTRGIQLTRFTFETIITVGIDGAFGRRFPYEERINLLSGSARDSLRRTLEGFYTKDIPWAEVINTAYMLTRQAFLEGDPSERADLIPEPPELGHLLDPLLLEGVPTVIFGKGDSGKTFVALGIAAAMTLGEPVAGLCPAHFGPALYIDYETNRNTFRYRWGRIVTGFGHAAVPQAPMFYWPGRGISVSDQADAIERRVRKEGIELIVIDSAAPACGGKPEDAETTERYFASLAHIDVTTLTIAHMNNDEESRRPFGSVFWVNQPRRLWQIKRAEKLDASVIDLGLYCIKNNDGPTPAPMGLKLGFSDRAFGGDGAIRINGADVAESRELAADLPLHRQIWAALAVPMSTKEIADETGMKETMVRALLNRHRGKLFAKAGLGEKWGRIALSQATA